MIKNGFMRFPMTPRTLFESFGLAVPHENLFDVKNMIPQIIFASSRNTSVPIIAEKLSFLTKNYFKMAFKRLEIQKIATSARLMQ